MSLFNDCKKEHTVLYPVKNSVRRDKLIYYFQQQILSPFQ